MIWRFTSRRREDDAVFHFPHQLAGHDRGIVDGRPRHLVQRAWQGKVIREANAWTAEIAIPFSSINAQKPKPDSIWLGNIARNRVHAGEASTWSKTDTTGSDPFSFGELCFLNKTLLNELHITPKDLPNGSLNFRVEGRDGLPPAGRESRSRTLITARFTANSRFRPIN